MKLFQARLHPSKVNTCELLDPEGGSQKVVVVVIISSPGSLKIAKAFLIRSGAQRNFAYTLPTDLSSQILHLFSN